MNDSELVKRARRGDSKAFDILARKYWEWAFALAVGLLEDFAAAQDVTQEAVEMKVGIFGYVWQQPQLGYHMSAVENVILPLVAAGIKKSSCIERTVEIFRFVSLEDEKRKLPVGKLSIFDRQRVVLARALITDPVVIIAEEPTGDMVPTDGQKFTALLRSVAEERHVAVICASHDLKVINAADRIAWMQNGRIVTIGTPAEEPSPKAESGLIVRFPGNICQWLYQSGKYTGIKKALLHNAAEKYEQAIEKATFLRAKPESTVEERIQLRINELRESTNLLSDVVSNLERVLNV